MNQKTDPGSSEVKPGLIRAFLYLSSGPGYAQERKNIFQIAKGRKILELNRTH